MSNKNLKKLTDVVKPKSFGYKGTPHEQYLRNMWITHRVPVNEPYYQSFDPQIKTFALKVSSPTPRKYVLDLVDRKLLFIGTSLDPSAKSGIFSGGVAVTEANKIAGVVVDSNFIKFKADLDTKEGTIGRIDYAFYSAYYHFIRGSIIGNSRSFRTDDLLHDLNIKYLATLILKVLGKNVYLSEKEKIFLDLCAKYFYYRFLLPSNHLTAYDKALEKQPKEIKTEVDDIFQSFRRYTEAKDLFKAVIDLNLTQENANMLMMGVLSKFGIVVFHSLITTGDFLTALAIVSKYPVEFAKSAFVSSSLQEKIESHVERQYMKKIKFDLKAVPS